MLLIRRCIFCALLLCALPPSLLLADGWKAAAAKTNITPARFMPMSGYASRGARHADGKLTDLWAKALVIEDEQGERAVLVTFDLIGIDRGLSASICAALQEEVSGAHWVRWDHELDIQPLILKVARPQRYPKAHELKVIGRRNDHADWRHSFAPRLRN